MVYTRERERERERALHVQKGWPLGTHGKLNRNKLCGVLKARQTNLESWQYI
jgi:hypothetical protein